MTIEQMFGNLHKLAEKPTSSTQNQSKKTTLK